MMDADVLIVFGKKRGSKDETNRPRQEVTVSGDEKLKPRSKSGRVRVGMTS